MRLPGPLSLRGRLMLTYCSILLAAFLGLAVLLHGLFSHSLHTQLDGDIQSDAAGAVAWLRATEARPQTAKSSSTHPTERKAVPALQSLNFIENDVFMELIGPSGQRVQASKNLGRAKLRAPAKLATLTGAWYYIRIPSLGSLRCRAVPVNTPHGVYVVIAAKSAEPIYRSIRSLDHIFMVAVPLMLLLAGAGGYLVAGRALKPIGTIAATARAIAEGDLSRRINPTGPQDELYRLAETFDEMIVSIDHLMTAQKRFFADASHELRTPLTVMLGTLEVRLRTQNATVPELRQSMEVAQDEARHMKRLVDHLMTLSRADSGQEILHLRTTELTELLQSTGETAKWMMEGRQLIFELQNEVLLTCDRERLRQLVLNLLSNAVQHTTQEGTIILALTATAEEIKICVTDNGTGVAAQHLPHIFERFYRADPARSRESGGSGLGLAICRWIAQAHGGTISAQSQVGRGTTLTLLLPRFPKRE